MKLEAKLKDVEMGVNSESNSQHKEDAVENTLGTLASQTISNDSQLNEIPIEDIASTSKVEKVTKVVEADECMTEDFISGSISHLDSIKSHQNKITLEGNPAAAEVFNKSFNIEDSKNHRQNTQYSSESSDFETDESSDSDEFFKNLHKNVILPATKLPTVVKTKGELLPFDLPPVEDLQITENVTNLQKIGNISYIVIAPERNEFFVIVVADGNSNPLDDDSVLFLSSGEPLGKIHDVFGNVNKPTYIVRFNNAEDIHKKGVTQKQDVFYSPSNGELTHYVLVDDLKQQKGSDASWKDNNEPPEDQIDYSDDEQEKIAKRKRKAKNRKNDRDSESEEEVVDVTPNNTGRSRGVSNQERAFQARPPRNKFRSSMPGPSRSSPHSYPSPRSFDSTPSPPNTFNPGTSGLQRNAQLSQSCGNAPFNNNRFGGFLQRNVPSPQSFGPFPQSNVPSPTPFGPFTQSRMPTPQSFGTFSPSNVPSYQPFSAPPTSHVFMPPNFTSSNSAGAPQRNPQSLMPAPQNNVPLQQQFQLQPQQPVGNFLSHPPPNYNSNQNSRTFLHQNQLFTPPTFGALPAAVHSKPNTSNQSFVNQILFRTNGPHNNFPGNLNISQPTPMNSNNQQGPSYDEVPSSAANSFMFSPTNTQHNNMHAVFGSNQSPCPTPPFVVNQSPCPTPPFVVNQSPCPTPPFVLCPTPPPMSTQQGFAIQSNLQPLVLPSQTPPPTFHQFALNLPVVRNPMPPHYPYS